MNINATSIFCTGIYVEFIHFCISIAFSLPFSRHLFEPFFRGSFRQEDEVESSTDDESPQVREL